MTALDVAVLDPPADPESADADSGESDSGDSDSGDSELDAFFEACPTSVAQQTPGWRDVITAVDADEPCFLGCRREGRLVGVLPAYRFEGPLGAILTSVSQAGPLGGVAVLPDEEEPEAVYGALLDAFDGLARDRHCAFASVLSNPFWPDRDLYEHHFAPDYVLENTCQVLDLDEALDENDDFILSSSNTRRNLRRAEGGALAIDEEQSAANVDTWYAIHAGRHREIGATPLPHALFTKALEHMVPRGKARFFFVRLVDSGEMVAGGFYLLHGAVMDALMPSLRTEYARLGTNFLLAAHSIRWARRRGVRYYNWQASPPESGVERFKRQWGSRELGYCYFTRITGDPEPVLASTPDALREAYPWHYVVPYDALGTGSRGGVSSRSTAWNALEDSR